jgi:hypothetical protein
MTQRGIREELVGIAVQFGYEHEDGKVILNRKGTQQLLEEIERIKRAAQKIMEVGGLCVVAQGDSMITTYRLGR